MEQTDNLEELIKALDSFGVDQNIINDMLGQLEFIRQKLRLPPEYLAIKKSGELEVCEQLIETIDKLIDLADVSKQDIYNPYLDGAHTAYSLIKTIIETKLRTIRGSRY